MKISRCLRQSLLAGALALLAVNATALPAHGDIPPDRVGSSYDGEPVLVSGFAGKVVVISYWATWCPYCLKELPVLESIQKIATKDRLQVIAVNTETRDVYRRAAKKLGSLQMLVAHDSNGLYSPLYGVNGIPHLVIVGRDGKIVNIYRGYGEETLKDIAADIDKALEAAP